MTAALALALLMSTSSATAAEHPSFGVVARSDDAFCLAAAGPPVKTGTKLVVIDPRPPQVVHAARVGEPTGTCEALQRALIDGPYYRVTLDSPPAEPAFMGIAVHGAPVRTEGDVARILLDARHPSGRVRQCASVEGLHLSVWPDDGLSGRPLWHRYWYLGYDVEPTCSDHETTESAGVR